MNLREEEINSDLCNKCPLRISLNILENKLHQERQENENGLIGAWWCGLFSRSVVICVTGVIKP